MSSKFSGSHNKSGQEISMKFQAELRNVGFQRTHNHLNDNPRSHIIVNLRRPIIIKRRYNKVTTLPHIHNFISETIGEG
jgi:hypothetical protein